MGGYLEFFLDRDGNERVYRMSCVLSRPRVMPVDQIFLKEGGSEKAGSWGWRLRVTRVPIEWTLLTRPHPDLAELLLSVLPSRARCPLDPCTSLCNAACEGAFDQCSHHSRFHQSPTDLLLCMRRLARLMDLDDVTLPPEARQFLPMMNGKDVFTSTDDDAPVFGRVEGRARRVASSEAW